MTDRLTDSDLNAIETRARYVGEAEAAQAQDVKHLLAELRRLRSDEWLERAAREIAEGEHAADSPLVLAYIAAILRRHRDQA